MQPCATMCHHVQPRATMCNAPMCYPCAQPCATMCTHVQCTDVLPMCTLCKAPMCHDITIHELLHVKPTSKNKITTLQTPAPVPAPKNQPKLNASTHLNQAQPILHPSYTARVPYPHPFSAEQSNFHPPAQQPHPPENLPLNHIYFHPLAHQPHLQ